MWNHLELLSIFINILFKYSIWFCEREKAWWKMLQKSDYVAVKCMFSCCKVLFVYEFLLKFFLRVFFFKWSFFDEKSNGFQKFLLWKWSYWVGQIQCQFKLRACHKINLPPRRGLPSVRQTSSLKDFYLKFFKQKFSVKLITLSD